MKKIKGSWSVEQTTIKEVHCFLNYQINKPFVKKTAKIDLEE